MAVVSRKTAITEADRLAPASIVESLRARGVPAELHTDADAIVAAIVPELRTGDVAVIMSNGGFGGIHGKLLAALNTVMSVK
jgi:UDP-N-acetylmuramate: L-alanyl-gamma-D-glutamyl-meso-diaminopimelate ligase